MIGDEEEGGDEIESGDSGGGSGDVVMGMLDMDGQYVELG